LGTNSPFGMIVLRTNDEDRVSLLNLLVIWLLNY
jgi:hypothetical protein